MVSLGERGAHNLSRGVAGRDAHFVREREAFEDVERCDCADSAEEMSENGLCVCVLEIGECGMAGGEEGKEG